MAADHNAQDERYRKPTRRDAFLATMEQIVPWLQLCGVIEPHYPKAGSGRPQVGLQRMLRMYFVQHGFNLGDQACEDALLDSLSLHRFVGIDLGRERVPDTPPPCSSSGACWRSIHSVKRCSPKSARCCRPTA